MNITTWLSENKAAAFLAIFFILGTGSLGYLAFSAWDDYGTATAEYDSKAKELDTLSHNAIFPSVSNLKKLTQTLSQDQSNLDKLQEALQSYIIPAFGDIVKIKPQDQPQYFQDNLRSQVTAIKSLAASSGSILPPSFYLGLDEYENRLPQPDQLPLLSKQLTILNWIAKTVATQKGVIIAEFARMQPDPGKTPTTQKKTLSPESSKISSPSSPYEILGSIRITLRCSQGAFRELINAFSSAPYFLVIEEIKVQNSVGEPPRREAVMATDQTQDGSTQIQRLPIVVGRESLNLQLKIRIVDFPVATNLQSSK